jgi:hypothetical protein
VHLLHLLELASMSDQRRAFEEHRQRAEAEIFKRNILLWEREAAAEEGGIMEDVDGVTVHLRWRNPNLSPEDKPHEAQPVIKPLSDVKPMPHAERPDVAVHHQHHSAHDSVVQLEDLTLTH